MASPALSVLITVARDYAQDNDANTSNYAFDATSILRLFNRFYVKWKGMSEDRFQELPSATTGLSFAANITYKDMTPTNIRRIVSLYYPTIEYGIPVELERVSLEEYQQWATMSQGAGDPGGPVRWAAHRLSPGLATGVGAGKWRIFVHPVSSVAGPFTYSALCEVEPVPMTATTDIPDCSDQEGYGLAALVGAFMAQRNGRLQLVDSALADVPDSMQSLIAAVRANKPPAAAHQVEPA